MAGSLAPMMYWAVHTIFCSALRSEAEQLPYSGAKNVSRSLLFCPTVPGSDATSVLDDASVKPFEGFSLSNDIRVIGCIKHFQLQFKKKDLYTKNMR